MSLFPAPSTWPSSRSEPHIDLAQDIPTSARTTNHSASIDSTITGTTIPGLPIVDMATVATISSSSGPPRFGSVPGSIYNSARRQDNGFRSFDLSQDLSARTTITARATIVAGLGSAKSLPPSLRILSLRQHCSELDMTRQFNMNGLYSSNDRCDSETHTDMDLLSFTTATSTKDADTVDLDNLSRVYNDEIIDSGMDVFGDNDVTTYTPAVPFDAIARSASPAPTEIEDPDSEMLSETLLNLGIKVRDFAYELHPPSRKEEVLDAATVATSTNMESATSFTVDTQDNHNDPPSLNELPVSVLKSSQPSGPVARDLATTSNNPNTSSRPRASEVFDQFKGITEYEYRLAQHPRTRPITGKTLRRLLDMGWVTDKEFKDKLKPMDWEALRAYDESVKARPGGKAYLWRYCRWAAGELPEEEEDLGDGLSIGGKVRQKKLRPPTADERRSFVEERWVIFLNNDKVLDRHEAFVEREQKEQMELLRAQEQIRARDMEVERLRDMTLGPDGSPPARKRILEDATEEGRVTPDFLDGSSSPTISLSQPLPYSQPTPMSPKRRKLLIATESSSSAPSLPSSQSGSQGPSLLAGPATAAASTSASSSSQPPVFQPQHMIPPTRQYPAPLHSYNPEMYPEAAALAASQASSQPPIPDLDVTPPATPKADEYDDSDWDAAGASDGDDDAGAGRRGGGRPLERRKRPLKRTLSRTLTFAQL